MREQPRARAKPDHRRHDFPVRVHGFHSTRSPQIRGVPRCVRFGGTVYALDEDRSMIRIAVTLAACALGASLSAQWPDKTPGIPRKADGRANLSAPAPRGP